MFRKFLFSIAALLLAACCISQAQTLTNLAHPAPDGAVVPFLLTDGTVLVQGWGGQDWWKLTPDINGSYVNGTWTQVASLAANYDPYAFASATLADGRVLIEGGEYNFGEFSFTNLGAVYDPVANTWTNLDPPPGWDYIGDSPSAILPNGHFLIGRKFDMQMADLDPSTMTWTAVGSSGKSDWFAEEGWTLMPDGTILTADVLNNPNSERYIPSQQRWVSDGSTIANLQGPPEVGCIQYGGGEYCPPGEIGPAILRPDGTVFATGATHSGEPAGHTSVYHPGASPTDPGTWVPGPDFQNGDDAGDNFAVLLTNGKVLVEGNSGRLYEFDGTNFTPTLFSSGSLIVLPTGEVLVGGSQVYTASSGALQFLAPIVTYVPANLQRGQSYSIFGHQFSGWSQAAAFGDEFETATNYPLVRIRNNATGHVFYARTHGHSTMAVQTRNVPEFTHLDVPAGMETGPSTLWVVTNGIASNAVSVMVN
ncbi:MAG TPA: hypothetical protein VL240_11650 [Candidatus Binatia bacterium]|nr:hypothetical protein [Candidatus Binatia bacterium]